MGQIVRSKQQILDEVREGLRLGVLRESDVRGLLHQPEANAKSEPVVITEYVEKPGKPDKLSAVDIMFYIAGIVLFAAIISMIVQTWSDGSHFVHVCMSAGVGLLLWAVAYYLIRSAVQSDIRKGLINALLLTGSLSIIAGGYIVTYDVVDGLGSDSAGFVPMSIALAVLAAMHLVFNRLVKRDLILLLGVLLGVATFPTLIFGFLQQSEAPMDVWAFVVILASGVLAYATRVAAKANPSQLKVRTSFDGFAAFVALLAMYVPIFGDYGVVWTVVLLASVFGIFYLSIISQNKHLLGNGAFFLVVSVITISFKYFSGYGITTSLIIATMGLLGTAAVAATINRKYFKQPAVETPEEKAEFPLPIHREDSQTSSPDESSSPKPQIETYEAVPEKPVESTETDQPESENKAK